MISTLRCGKYQLDLTAPVVMGVLNVTPDSFSDGGQFNRVDKALAHARQMLMDGAKIVDVGGESTRPGAAAVSLQEEMDRVCPVVEALVAEYNALVSVDTSSPKLMAEAVRLGAGIVNDVRAFQREGAIEAVAGSDAALCMMHMQGQPVSMQQAPLYENVIEEVGAFFEMRIRAMCQAGIPSSRLILDPGFGFGKSLGHNLTILRQLADFSKFNVPVLAGLSRKSMLGLILDKPVEERLIGSVSAALLAAQNGAKILRVHDVAETMDALKVWQAVLDR
jgi:dihydropteroate synthase